MVKWMLTIGCAVALLAIAQGAKAYELDEDGNPVFYDEDELNEYLLWLAGQGTSKDPWEESGGEALLDFCVYVRPAAYAVTARHYISGSGWHSHVITDVRWDSAGSTYYVCGNLNTHALSDVDGLYCAWRHIDHPNICVYCASTTLWDTDYRQVGVGWAQNDYAEGCAHTTLGPDYWVYWGEERDWFQEMGGWDYSTGNAMCRFTVESETGNDWISKVKVYYCDPE